MTCIFSLMHVLWNKRSWDDPTSLTHERIRRDFYYIWTSHPSIALVIELGRCNVHFWLTSWTLFICALFKIFKEYIEAQRNLQHLGCWNHLEKLAEMFPNTFHREHILLKLKTKKLLRRKIESKNLTAWV